MRKIFFCLTLLLFTTGILFSQEEDTSRMVKPKPKGRFTNTTEFIFGYENIRVDQLSGSYNYYDPNSTTYHYNTDQSNLFSFGLQTITGYQFDRNFSIGVGVGIIRDTGFLMPMFLEEKVCFLKGKVTPFLSVAGGYNFALQKNYKGGLLIAPSLGIKFFISPKIALNFSFGYRFNENKFFISKESWLSTRRFLNKRVENTLTFKAGVTF
jgi:hypothetical protein